MRYENVTLSRGGAKLLRQFSLEAEPGRITCLMGPSGVGKSTLLRLAAGLIAPDSGSIIRGPRYDRIGYVFQEHRLLPWKTVLANVEWVLCDRLDRAAAREKARKWLEAAGLGSSLSAMPEALSGGMRQRVSFARALAAEPSLLLLDEPFQSLDTANRQRLQQLLLRYWEHHRPTVLLVTHDPEEALHLGNHIVLLGGTPVQIKLSLHAEAEPGAEHERGARRHDYRSADVSALLTAIQNDDPK
jgi:ABC-type nitrate/sulfonate/bicarbonate transport system ATPase subunit